MTPQKFVWSSGDLEFDTVSKGDYPGHPFRGNQWTGGIGRGVASGSRRAVADMATTKDKGKKKETFTGTSDLGGGEYLSGDDGSYYDYIDWDDPDYHPVQQLLDMAAEHLGFTDIEIKDADLEDVDPQHLAECLDALQYMHDWFGEKIPLGALTFERMTAGGTYTPSTKDIALNINAIIKGPAGKAYIENYYAQRSSESAMGHFASAELSGSQYVAVHEFGHAVEYAIFAKAPALLWEAESRAATMIANTHGKASKPLPKNPHKASDTGKSFWDLRNETSVTPFGWLFQAGNYKLMQKISLVVGAYAQKNWRETFAELFASAYGTNPKRLKGPAKALYDALEDLWPKIETRL